MSMFDYTLLNVQVVGVYIQLFFPYSHFYHQQVLETTLFCLYPTITTFLVTWMAVNMTYDSVMPYSVLLLGYVDNCKLYFCSIFYYLLFI